MRPAAPAAGDVLAGLTVACVLVPQSLAYAQLAGMPPERGLLAAALPPVAAALAASSPHLQTGPVALTCLLTFGALSALAPPGSDAYVQLGIVLALVVGGVRLAIWALGLGRVVYAMSPAVLVGFVNGAALLIVASQTPTLLGLSPDGSVIGSAVRALSAPNAWEASAVLLGLASILVVVAVARGSSRFPGVLVACALGLAVGAWSVHGGPQVGAFSMPVPLLPTAVAPSHVPALLLAGLVIAVVGFAETAAIARTLAARDRRPWSANREFASQGVANVAAAAAGGFPVGASFSRTALNRLAGARTRWSGAIAGLAVLALLPFASGLLAPLPRAVLAGIVIASVSAFVRPLELLRLCRLSPPQGAIAVATFAAALVLAPNVHYAVLLGIGLSVANHLLRELAIDVEASVDGTTLRVRPRGVLWFGSARSLEEKLAALLAGERDVDHVEIDLGGLGRIDYSGALVLRSLAEELGAAGVEFRVVDPSPRARRIVSAVLDGELEPARVPA